MGNSQRSSQDTGTSEGVWSWKSNKDPWSTTEPEQWTQYEDQSNKLIETAYQKNKSSVEIEHYKIFLKKMIQVSKQDLTRQRPIKREIKVKVNNLREDRFLAAPPRIKSINNFHRGHRNFMDEWWNDHSLGFSFEIDEDGNAIAGKADKFLLECVEKAAEGIIREGKALKKEPMAELMANKLRETIKNNPKEIFRVCAYLYTTEGFLYKSINQALREEDFTKTDTLGAFGCLLDSFAGAGTSVTSKLNYNKVVYRGCNLSQEQINDYLEYKHNIFRWYAFTSTSKNKKKAEGFGNVLFIISLVDEEGKIPEGTDPKDYGWYGGEVNGVDISTLSHFPDEEEVLLPPTTIYKILKIENDESLKKYFIYLSVYRWPNYL